MTEERRPLQTVIDERDHLRNQLTDLTGAGCEALPGLTKLESRIVRALEQAEGRVLSNDALMHALYWDRVGKDEPEPKIVTVYIAHIRKKRPDLKIETVWGEGYRLEPREKAMQ